MTDKELYNKLELIRRVYNLGISDVEKALEKSHCKDHMIRKFIGYRDEYGFDGNFRFLFACDEHNADLMLTYLENRNR